MRVGQAADGTLRREPDPAPKTPGPRLYLVTTEKIVWVDCEMTGLDLGKDKLIEISALVTDGELNILGAGVDLVIHADDDALASMPEVVQRMHAKSGLTDEVRASTVTMADAEAAVLAYVRQHVPADGKPLLAGNSIATDRGFI